MRKDSGGVTAWICIGTFGLVWGMMLAFGFMGLGPGGLFLRSRTSLAELLRLFCPGTGMAGR